MLMKLHWVDTAPLVHIALQSLNQNSYLVEISATNHDTVTTINYLVHMCCNCATSDHLYHYISMRLRTSPSSSEPASSDSDDAGGCGGVDITLSRLESLHLNGTVNKKDLTEYAQWGISSTRIKQAVSQPRCPCKCKLPLKVLYHLCVAFWTLTKPSQDSLLWTIQQESGNQKRKQWYLAGPKVKKHVF